MKFPDFYFEKCSVKNFKMLKKNIFGWEVLRDINKLKNGHYYRHLGVAFRFFRLLPISGSAFPSRDQSRYSERSYCTQILLEGYIMYPLHQSMFFAFLYHFFSCFIKKRKIYIFSCTKYYHPWHTKGYLYVPRSIFFFESWQKIEFAIVQTTSLS